MQGIGLTKFSTIVSEISSFLGYPVYLEKKIVVEIVPIHLPDRLSWTLSSKYNKFIFIQLLIFTFDIYYILAEGPGVARGKKNGKKILLKKKVSIF